MYGAIRFVAETPGFDDRITRQPSRTKSAATPAIIARPAGLVGSFTTGPPPDDPEPGFPGTVNFEVAGPMPGALTCRLILAPFWARLPYVNVKVDPRLSATLL